MTPDSSPQENTHGETPRPAHSGYGPVATHPFFWFGAGALAGLLILFLILRGCAVPQTPASAPGRHDDGLAELIELQRAQNSGLEEEIRRLHSLLEQDPCSLSGLLGPSPETSPVAPGYANPYPPPPRAPSDARETVPPVLQPAPAPATVSALMAEATVFVLATDHTTMGMGSGFFVAPGIVVTNSHVALNAQATVYVGNKALGGMHEARVIAYSADPSRDYALLRIPDNLAGKAPVLRLGVGATRTERVSAWGFPGYIAEIDPKLAALAKGDTTSVPEVVYSEGVVSVVLDRKPPVILHTAAISQGNSGGPLSNAEGVVVGINTFIKIADQSYSQTNIALAGSDLALFLQEHGIAVARPIPQTGLASAAQEKTEQPEESNAATGEADAQPGER